MKDLLKRLVTGIVLAGFLFLFLWLSTFSQVIFDMLIYVMGFIGVIEMYFTMKKKYKPMLIPLLAVAVISYPAAYFLSYFGILITMGAGLLLSAAFFVFARKKKEDRPTEATKENLSEFAKYNSSDLGITWFIMAYPLLILNMIFVMNLKFGMLPLMLAAGAALVSDLFAYLVGSIVKGPKIFPTISPKKTYSGCIGGIIGGGIGALAVFAIFEIAKYPANISFTFLQAFGGNMTVTVLFYLFVGMILAVIGQTGDLFASRFKRELQIKDFSKLLGAHGGVMDRIDSTMLVVIPVFMIMVIFFA